MKSSPKQGCAETLPEERLFVAIVKLADALSLQAEQLIKTHNLTSTQYNVLRILRGAEPEGLLCRGISERMISHDPDMTRLLDRMEKRGLITRERQKNDRRVVKTRITAEGLAALKKLDQPVRELHKTQFAQMKAGRIKALLELLDEAFQSESSSPQAASNFQ